jgi:hypothetical protein
MCAEPLLSKTTKEVFYMSKMLLNEPPILVSRELACSIGLNEAIILQQIHYWLENNRKAHRNFKDGRYWTYNSIRKWHEEFFDFWCSDTVKRTFARLVKKGYLITASYNRKSFDQTKWYTINYETIENLTSSDSLLSSMLFNEHPILLSRCLARKIGLNESIVVQQVHYWLEINRKIGRNFVDGKFWTYNSYKGWQENNFGFWSVETVKRAILSTESSKLLISGNYNDHPMDSTKWYTINYEVFESLSLSDGSKCTNGDFIGRSKCTNPTGHFAPMTAGQNALIPQVILHQPIPETNQRLTRDFHSIPSGEKNGMEWNGAEIKEDKIKNSKDREIVKKEFQSFLEEKSKEVEEKMLKSVNKLVEKQILEPKKVFGERELNKDNISSNKVATTSPNLTIDYNKTLEEVKNQINFDALVHDVPQDIGLVNEVVGIIAGVLCANFKDDTITLGKENMPQNMVKNVFRKLDMYDIKVFMAEYQNIEYTIKKPVEYIRASLYRNYVTKGHGVSNEVMVGYRG